MATVVNRSPFVVRSGKEVLGKFRSKSAALAFAKEHGKPCKVTQDTQGSWEAVVRLKDAEGKTHREARRFDTEGEAKEWADGEEEKLKGLRKSATPFSAAKTPFGKAVSAWYEAVGSKLKGAKVIKYNMAGLVEDIGAELPLDEVSVQVVREWRDGMKEEGYTASTIANHRQILSGTFRYWISEKDFPGINPARNVLWDKPDNVSEPPTLSAKEEEKLFKAVERERPWLLPMVKFAALTAMRQGEILALTWADVDFAEGVVRIRGEKNDWKKKNTEEKGRKVPIWAALKAFFEALQPDKEKRVGRVFEGTSSSVSHAFADAFKASGLDKPGFNFHSLRKVATGRLSKSLPNVVELAKVTGHKDLETLATRYYGMDLKELAKKIR